MQIYDCLNEIHKLQEMLVNKVERKSNSDFEFFRFLEKFLYINTFSTDYSCFMKYLPLELARFLPEIYCSNKLIKEDKLNLNMTNLLQLLLMY
jgi:hypothetical protein